MREREASCEVWQVVTVTAYKYPPVLPGNALHLRLDSYLVFSRSRKNKGIKRIK